MPDTTLDVIIFKYSLIPDGKRYGMSIDKEDAIMSGPYLVSPKISREYRILGKDAEGIEAQDVGILLKMAKTREELYDIVRIRWWLQSQPGPHGISVTGWADDAVSLFRERVKFNSRRPTCPYAGGLAVNCPP